VSGHVERAFVRADGVDVVRTSAAGKYVAELERLDSAASLHLVQAVSDAVHGAPEGVLEFPSVSVVVAIGLSGDVRGGRARRTNRGLRSESSGRSRSVGRPRRDPSYSASGDVGASAHGVQGSLRLRRQRDIARALTTEARGHRGRRTVDSLSSHLAMWPSLKWQSTMKTVDSVAGA
jgi:hypothetical protein